MQSREKYGLKWKEPTDDLQIEFYCIRKGGTWKDKGKTYGKGLQYHFEQARKLMWPHLDSHRWHHLCLKTHVENKVTVLMGPGSSGKTHEAAWYRLTQYFVSPDDTMVLVSSTDMRGLRLRVWGEMIMLWEKAVAAFPWLPGHLLDSKLAITTDQLTDEDIDEDRRARDLRKGIIGIPCMVGGKFVGLGKYAGIKQKNVFLIADEAQFMGESFLSAFANLNKNERFEATVLGNPNDILDPLGKAAEPEDGWEGHLEPKKTTTWKTRFLKGTCVNLIGTDSPNFDFPEKEPTRYKYLISREKIADTLSFFPADSIEYYSQCVGIMKIGLMLKRIITRSMCRQFKAQEKVIWMGTQAVKIAALDSAYGGDRAVLGFAEMGKDVEGQTIISLNQPVIVPVLVNDAISAEDQIAKFVRQYCEQNGVPPENFFHDSTGRGSLGTTLARVWSDKCNPVEFGGSPTPRPVSMDMLIWDPKLRQKRPVRCDEYYDRFVTELWFSVRYSIEGGHIRNLPGEVMDELCMREFELINKGKRSVEKKEDMKLRIGKSPDMGDWASIIIEGARRRGFVVKKLGTNDDESSGPDPFARLRERVNRLRQAHVLDHAA